MTSVVGYKLIDAQGGEHAQWGGVWGQCPGVPNPVILPGGDHVHAPSLNVDYGGYMLVEWLMDEPPPPVPEFITRRQCALELHARQIVTLEEALAMTKTAEVPAAIAQVFDAAVTNGQMTAEQRMLAEIDFAAINYYRANSLLGFMGLTDPQIDEFFIAAGQR